MPEFQLVGCFDANPDACSKIAQAYKIQAFESMEALCDEVDVVNIATPSSLHKGACFDSGRKGLPCARREAYRLERGGCPRHHRCLCARGGGGCVSGMWSATTRR